jgi:hypothetical protein
MIPQLWYELLCVSYFFYYSCFVTPRREPVLVPQKKNPLGEARKKRYKGDLERRRSTEWRIMRKDKTDVYYFYGRCTKKRPVSLRLGKKDLDDGLDCCVKPKTCAKEPCRLRRHGTIP